jgi:hypothetical protein
MPFAALELLDNGIPRRFVSKGPMSQLKKASSFAPRLVEFYLEPIGLARSLPFGMVPLGFIGGGAHVPGFIRGFSRDRRTQEG